MKQLLLFTLGLATLGLSSCYGTFAPGKSFDPPSALEQITEAAAPLVVYEIKANAEAFIADSSALQDAPRVNEGSQGASVSDSADKINDDSGEDWKAYGKRIAAAGVIEAAKLWLESRELPLKSPLRIAPKQSPPEK